MAASTIRLFAISVLRALLALGGAYLVGWGFVDNSLMERTAEIVAFLMVDRVWEFYLLHRNELYQRWLVVLGLKASPFIQPSSIRDAAASRVREGLRP